MRVDAGRLDELAFDRCVAIGDGRAIVARVGDTVVALQNRCLHQNSPLAGGRLHKGVLTCPMHFWRYQLPGGTRVGQPSGTLTAFDVEVIDGVVFVDLPDPEPEIPIREQLLRHARQWSRDEADA